jgi:hypothetical protein
MWEDPIVKEVRRVRREHAARFGYDLHRVYADLKERERRSGRKYASYPPRRPATVAADAQDSQREGDS